MRVAADRDAAARHDRATAGGPPESSASKGSMEQTHSTLSSSKTTIDFKGPARVSPKAGCSTRGQPRDAKAKKKFSRRKDQGRLQHSVYSGTPKKKLEIHELIHGLNYPGVTEGHVCTPSPPSIGALPSVGAQKQPDGTEGGARRGRPYG